MTGCRQPDVVHQWNVYYLMGNSSVTELHSEQFSVLLLVVLQKRLVLSGSYVMYGVLLTPNYPDKNLCCIELEY